MELVQRFDFIFHIILVVLAVMLVLCLIRAIVGPRIADRIVAVNMMGTMVMVIISILALLMNEGYLVDICLIYAMISFLRKRGSIDETVRMVTIYYRDRTFAYRNDYFLRRTSRCF